jgi:nitroreductase
MLESLAPILDAARLAPSGDNTQPIRFAVDTERGTIALIIDPTRDPSPMNAGQRMARMAAGASIENLVRAAEGLGYHVDIEVNPSNGTLALVRLIGSGSGVAPMLAPIPDRVTNRRAFDGREVAADVLSRLAAECPPIGGASTHWIVGRDRIEAFAGLIGESDAAMFGDPSMRQAFLSKVRFDEPRSKTVEEGLSLDSLEVGPADRMALRAMRRMPDRLLKLGGGLKVFARKARELVRSASGLCLVVAPDGSEASDIASGRALQRSWLALAGEGLATQPMMTLLVLENVAENGEGRLIDAIGRDKLASIRDRFRALAPEIDGRRPAWLLRFGYAPPPTGRTGRLPVEALLIGPRG